MSVIVKPMPEEPADEAPFAEKLAWLLLTHGFCEQLDRVVKLFEPSDQCLLTRPALTFSRKPWQETVVGPKGGETIVYAAAVWAERAERPKIRAVRMRPDQDFPTYEEGGGTFKNTYRRPVHLGSGNIAPFLDFMERFLPDEKQREWLYKWMAHKQARPEIPGTAVLFIADTDEGVREGKFGTGRGMFFKVLHKLYGEEYSRAEDFDILDGSSGQAAYTDWRHNSVLITIDEAKSSPTSYRRGERSAVYEVLKNVVDPAPKRCRFKSKYGVAFDGWSYASFMVACNHADAIAIPANDRRFTVLLNGRGMTPGEAKMFAGWMADAGNIAALSHFLAACSLKDFDMFQPLDTMAKQDMAELALTQVEGILRDLMEDDAQELAFTRYQMEQEVERILKGGASGGSHPGPWRGEFEAAWKSYCMLLKTQAGSPSRVRVAGRQTKLYCFRTRKKQIERLPEAARQASARKRGGIDAAITKLTTELTEGER